MKSFPSVRPVRKAGATMQKQTQEAKDYRYLDTLPDSSMLSLDEVLTLLRISRSSWYGGLKTGKFPKAVYIGPNSPRWRCGTIRSVAEGTYEKSEVGENAA